MQFSLKDRDLGKLYFLITKNFLFIGRTSELSGKIELHKKNIIEDKDNYSGKYFWKNIFGPPNQASSIGEQAQLMCENPELGTAWRGRILFHTSVEFTEKPVF